MQIWATQIPPPRDYLFPLPLVIIFLIKGLMMKDDRWDLWWQKGELGLFWFWFQDLLLLLEVSVSDGIHLECKC